MLTRKSARRRKRYTKEGLGARHRAEQEGIYRDAAELMNAGKNPSEPDAMAIAERGRYPAINVLRSISRTMPRCNTQEESALINRARTLLARYDDMADMIRLGAYRQGSSVEIDEAIRYAGPIEAFLAQDKDERSDLAAGYAGLAEILTGQQE